jgi:hypothetical protein
LLDDIEARDPCFLYAIAGILDAGLFECFNEFWFDMYMNKDDLHVLLLL